MLMSRARTHARAEDVATSGARQTCGSGPIKDATPRKSEEWGPHPLDLKHLSELCSSDLVKTQGPDYHV
ncbi:hypothetical protein HispidOSU_021204 [Sigmodon hispidus]